MHAASRGTVAAAVEREEEGVDRGREGGGGRGGDNEGDNADSFSHSVSKSNVHQLSTVRTVRDTNFSHCGDRMTCKLSFFASLTTLELLEGESR